MRTGIEIDPIFLKLILNKINDPGTMVEIFTKMRFFNLNNGPGYLKKIVFFRGEATSKLLNA